MMEHNYPESASSDTSTTSSETSTSNKNNGKLVANEEGEENEDSYALEEEEVEEEEEENEDSYALEEEEVEEEVEDNEADWKQKYETDIPIHAAINIYKTEEENGRKCITIKQHWLNYDLPELQQKGKNINNIHWLCSKDIDKKTANKYYAIDQQFNKFAKYRGVAMENKMPHPIMHCSESIYNSLPGLNNHIGKYLLSQDKVNLINHQQRNNKQRTNEFFHFKLNKEPKLKFQFALNNKFEPAKGKEPKIGFLLAEDRNDKGDDKYEKINNDVMKYFELDDNNDEIFKLKPKLPTEPKTKLREYYVVEPGQPWKKEPLFKINDGEAEFNLDALFYCLQYLSSGQEIKFDKDIKPSFPLFEFQHDPQNNLEGSLLSGALDFCGKHLTVSGLTYNKEVNQKKLDAVKAGTVNWIPNNKEGLDDHNKYLLNTAIPFESPLERRRRYGKYIREHVSLDKNMNIIGNPQFNYGPKGEFLPMEGKNGYIRNSYGGFFEGSNRASPLYIPNQQPSEQDRARQVRSSVIQSCFKPNESETGLEGLDRYSLREINNSSRKKNSRNLRDTLFGNMTSYETE